MRSMFTTHGADSALNSRSGQQVEVIRPLTDEECDKLETGPMFRIRFDDGVEVDAFGDEVPELMSFRIAEVVYDITTTVCAILWNINDARKCSVEDSRVLFQDIYEWANEFEREHFNSENYLTEVEEFATKKTLEYFGLEDSE